MLGGRASLELLDRRRSTGLTNRVLSSARLAGSESAGHGGSREADRADESRLGTRRHFSAGVKRKRRGLLLVTTAEGVGGWRRERDDILRWCHRLLGRRCAARPRVGVDLIGRRNVEDRSTGIGRRVCVTRRWWRRGVRQVVLLLVHGIDDILVLTGHLIEDKVNARLTSLLHGRSALLELLAVGVSQGRSRELLLTQAVEVHVAELLSSKGEELLLELLLPLSKVSLGSEELSSNGGIHLAIIILHSRRSQDLVVEHVLLLLLLLLLVVLVDTTKAGTDGSLRTVQGKVPGQAVVLVTTDAVLTLIVGRRRRGLGRRGRLGGGAEAGQKMGAAGARSLNLVLGDGGDLGRGGDAEAFEGSTLAARRKARGRVAEALGLEVVVGHLSKTASVHAHVVEVVEGCEQRVKLQQDRCAEHTRKDIERKGMSRVEGVAGDERKELSWDYVIKDRTDRGGKGSAMIEVRPIGNAMWWWELLTKGGCFSRRCTS